ncbi:FKBP-type peptidyl-prolyl cis-trans isomerase [Streptomyces sp. NPDC052013]|uniref:FKBP-type peptidyl-prolyl cis-trans isomerase n=1 Tax=Streptomyces sp. NPDC052013 TaxID=3365679 RepID=UPI0037D64BF2
MPAVSGAPGRRPKVAIPATKPDKTYVVSVLARGHGPVIRKGDTVSTHYLAQTWRSRKTILDSRSKGAGPQVFTAGSGQLLPGLDAAVVGKRQGDRVLVIVPPGGPFGLNRLEQAGVRNNDTVVFVLDLTKVTPPTAPPTKPTPHN